MSTMHPHEGERNNADVQSSKKRRTAKDNSDGRGGSNRRFDEASTHAQKTLIKSYTNLYIAHLDENKGKCKRGFMQEDLLERWRKIKGRQTPQPSPISSDDEGSVDDDASDNDNDDEVALEHGVAQGVLVFGDEFNTEDSDGESDTDDA